MDVTLRHTGAAAPRALPGVMLLNQTPCYLGAGQLAACHLNAATPAGLFVSIDAENAMLVHRNDGGAAAVRLDGSPGNGFKVWTLEPNATSWFGMALGIVEVEVDFTSMSREEAGPGCVEIRGAQAHLVTRGDHPWERGRLPLATTAGGALDQGRSAAFTRWRFVQRDHLGGPVPLFAYDAGGSSHPR